jgi:hypothetical protein
VADVRTFWPGLSHGTFVGGAASSGNSAYVDVIHAQPATHAVLSDLMAVMCLKLF